MSEDYKEKRDISFDPSDKRKYYRLTKAVKVRVDGIEYKTLDWSISACKISDYDGHLNINEEAQAEFEINFQGFIIKFAQKIKVLRKENETLVVEYIDVSPRNKEILGYFSKSLITGEFQAFGDVIKHVDIPITDDYINENFQGEAVCRKPYAHRNMMISLYIILGIAVLLYAFKLFYSNIYLMKIDSAVVTSQTEIINSPSKGILANIYAKKGDSLYKGQPLFRIFDPEIEREIEDKKIEILKNKAILREKQKKLGNLEFKLKQYKKNLSFKLMAQTTVIESTNKKINLVNEELSKKELLFERQLVSKPEIDLLEKEMLQLGENLALAYYKYDSTLESLEHPEESIQLSDYLRSNSKDLGAEIKRIRDIIKINEKDLAYSELINDINTAKAPFEGTLTDILTFEGENIGEKAPIVILTNALNEKYIEAYLEEDDALKLKLGCVVTVNIPSYGTKIKGKLIQLEKPLNISDNSPTIATIKPENPELLENITIGSPAKVIFVKNNSLAPFINRIKSIQNN